MRPCSASTAGPTTPSCCSKAKANAFGDELLLTHELLAMTLSGRRAGVTVALQELAVRGLVSTARGRIIVVDRDGLEESANGLYGVPEAEYNRLFPMA